MFSIDQNCHPLWDTIPKLQALTAAGRTVTHCIEDIDVAFTALGAGPDDDDHAMRLVRERFHRSGGQDWGAALFYSEFLGKLPVEIRRFESAAGMKLSSLAKKIGRSVDDLYDQYSPGDNWQLIGSSYVADKYHHRVIGDLTVAETAPFLREMMDRARADLDRRFFEPGPRRRIADWFQQETARLEEQIRRCAEGRLVELYRRWMRPFVGGGLSIRLTSDLLGVPDQPERLTLLERFCRDYDTAAGLYNQAIEQTDVGLRPLKTRVGELPFFAVLDYRGHRVRTHMRITEEGLHVGGRRLRKAETIEQILGALADAGVRAVAGKALLLVLQVRAGPGGRALALPHMGSLYMPAAHRLGELLGQHGLLTGPVAPVVRVHLGLLDHMRGVDTRIRLPDHLAAAMGRQEATADELGHNWRDLQDQARNRLDALADDEKRLAWQEDHLPELTGRIEQIQARRIEIVREDPKAAQARQLWARQRDLQSELLDRTLEQIARDTQTAELETWDSRGAILPWSIALGGKELYDAIIDQAELIEETP